MVHRYLSNDILKQDEAANTSVLQISSWIQLFSGSRISHFWSVSVPKRVSRGSLSTVLSVQRNVLLIPGFDVLWAVGTWAELIPRPAMTMTIQSGPLDDDPRGASLHAGMMRNSIRRNSAPNRGALKISTIRNL